MSATMAWSDFLQVSGKLPASLTIPPFWPPMPSAQVLQAFLLRMDFQKPHGPPIDGSVVGWERRACQPPPLVSRFIENRIARKCTECDASATNEPARTVRQELAYSSGAADSIPPPW